MQSSTRFTGRKFEMWISTFSPGAKVCARRLSGSRLVHLAVDEIVNDADFVLHAEDFHACAARR